MSQFICSSVGKGGVNREDDVRTIQLLINIHFKKKPQFRAKLMKPLALDCDCGPATIKAIETFQKVVMGWSRVDGLVAVNGKTWKALNGNVTSTAAIVKKRVNLKPVNLSGQYHRYNQFSYPNEIIGNSSTKTIYKIGCTLTTLTMAATAIGSRTSHWPANLEPKDLTPVTANTILKSAGAFSKGKGWMTVSEGAKALGMHYDEYGRDKQGNDIYLTSKDLARIQSHLSLGYPVAAHVDYGGSGQGDHWILLIRKSASGYVAIDPASGLEITLKASSANNTRYQGERLKQNTGVLFGETGGQAAGAGPRTRKKQQKYIVVRFGLLSPMKPLNTLLPISHNINPFQSAGVAPANDFLGGVRYQLGCVLVNSYFESM